jgi:chaperone required for assembly of F1-ATPase
MSDEAGGCAGGNGSADGKGRPIVIPGRQSDAKPLPRRFYKDVSLGVVGPPPGHAVLLDGRMARTPGKRELKVRSVALAEAMAREWADQGVHIDPASMPLTRLVNTSIDGVAERMTEVAADVVKYAGSDLVCYRATYPDGLIARQRAHWDPVLAWSAEVLGARFIVVDGLLHVAQPAEAIERFAAAIEPLDALQLTALHVMTTLMGSALLAMAVVQGRITPEAAWEAAHVDEDWQIAEWGEDAEAMARREKRWGEMRAAAASVRLTSN